MSPPEPNPADGTPGAGAALLPSWPARLEARLRDHRTAAAALVLGLSLALRLAHFAAAATGYQADLHRWDQSDMSFFDAWAERIADGDVLGREPFHPLHEWHVEIAAAHFARVPDDPAAPRPGADPQELRAAARTLWDRWYGGARLHQEPLYPHALAAVRLLVGADVRWVFALQLALGAVACLLVFLVARRAFGDLVGLVTGAALVLSPLPLHFETALLRTAPTTFACALFAWLLSRATAARGLRPWAALGCCGGLAVLLQSTLVLLCGLALLVALADAASPWRTRLARGAVLFVTAFAWLLPVAARNAAVGAPLLALSSVGPVTFLRANAADVPPDAPGTLPAEAARILAESDGNLRRAATLTLATHDGPRSILAMEWGKLAQVLHWYERPNNTNFYLDRRASLVLRILPMTWRVLAPLAVLGLVLALARWRAAAPVLVPVVALVAPLLAFHVLSRYRAPLAVAATPLAALAAVELIRRLASRRHASCAAMAGAVAALATWTAAPLPVGRHVVHAADIALAYSVHHEAAIRRAEAEGSWDRAAELWADVERLEPPIVARLAAGRPARGRDETDLADIASRLSAARARALERAGRAGEAMEASERARRLAAAAAEARAPP